MMSSTVVIRKSNQTSRPLTARKKSVWLLSPLPASRCFANP